MATTSLTVDGLDGLINDLDAFIGDVDQAAMLAIKSSLVVIENAMVNNANSMLSMSYSKNVLVNSISSTAVIGKDGYAAGSVGVYNMSRKTGSTKRRATAPLVAFFHSQGTQPHSLAPGARTARRATAGNPFGAPARGQDTGVQHPGFVASPFLSNAWNANNAKITDKIIEALNKVAP